MNNAANIYLASNNDAESVFSRSKKLYILLLQKYLYEEAQFCVEFFDKSHTRTKIFREIYEDKIRFGSEDLYNWLARLSNYDCTEIIIKEYQEHNITNSDIGIYQSFLDYSKQDLNQSFNKRINEVSSQQV